MKKSKKSCIISTVMTTNEQNPGDIVPLRTPVRKNQTSRGKGGKFNFSHTLMLDRLGYN